MRRPTFSRDDVPFFVEAIVLVAGLAVLLSTVVPLDWGSIWGEHEFSSWVAPVANRLAGGQRLYADGAHTALPPLPFVLVYVLSRGHATWYLESLLHHLFQALTIVTMFLGLSRHVPAPAPFLAAFGTIPIFFYSGKKILYDPLTQFFVAVQSVVLVTYVTAAVQAGADRSEVGGSTFTSLPRRRAPVVVMGVVTALCLLSKQNTGVGLILGSVVALIAFPVTASLSTRLPRAVAYILATSCALVGFCALLSPFMSVRGFVDDVLLTGAQVKGGTAVLLAGLRGFWLETFHMVASWRGLVASALVAGLVLSESRTGSPGASGPYRSSRPQRLALSLAGLGAAAFVLWQWGDGNVRLRGDPVAGPPEPLVVALSLAILLVLRRIVAGRRRRAAAHDRSVSALAAFTCVTFPPALFHSLSVTSFRWTYDNNPLIVVALAALFLVVVRVADRLAARGRIASVAATVTAGALVFTLPQALWPIVTPMLGERTRCTREWPEIAYLAGVRLSDNAGALRRLVGTVRRLAGPDDRVLLLPNDPNVEAWFDRPRPHLNAAIVYADQYWDRYVDDDVARLIADPPAVIVIAPRSVYEGGAFWNRGTGRLTQRVVDELLPGRYVRYQRQPILFDRRPELLDVYTRRIDGAG